MFYEDQQDMREIVTRQVEKRTNAYVAYHSRLRVYIIDVVDMCWIHWRFAYDGLPDELFEYNVDLGHVLFNQLLIELDGRSHDAVQAAVAHFSEKFKETWDGIEETIAQQLGT